MLQKARKQGMKFLTCVTSHNLHLHINSKIWYFVFGNNHLSYFVSKINHIFEALFTLLEHSFKLML